MTYDGKRAEHLVGRFCTLQRADFGYAYDWGVFDPDTIPVKLLDAFSAADEREDLAEAARLTEEIHDAYQAHYSADSVAHKAYMAAAPEDEVRAEAKAYIDTMAEDGITDTPYLSEKRAVLEIL